MKINLKSSQPIFVQIIEGMHSSIAAGIYKPGERVPSARDLAVKLKVNPNTVQRAYEELVRSGALVSLGNRGKVVAKRAEVLSVKRSEASVKQAFQNGVAIAVSSGLSNRRIKQLLDEVIKTNQSREIA